MTAEEIAACWTPAKKAVVLALDGSWQLAPYCGWHRRQGRVARSLVTLGIAEMDKSRTSDGTPMFRLNEVGQQVRSILEGTSHAD